MIYKLAEINAHELHAWIYKIGYHAIPLLDILKD